MNVSHDPSIDKIRLTLTVLVQDRSIEPEDIIVVLSEVLDDYATEYGRRTGDYPHATHYLAIARALRVLEYRIKRNDFP